MSPSLPPSRGHDGEVVALAHIVADQQHLDRSIGHFRRSPGSPDDLHNIRRLGGKGCWHQRCSSH